VGALQAAWNGPSSYDLVCALLAVRASGRNVDRRQHNEHAEDGVKHDARAVRCPGHDVFPFFQQVCPVVADIGGRAAPVCDLRHTFALLGGSIRFTTPSSRFFRPYIFAFLALTTVAAAAQSWGMYSRIGLQRAKNFKEPCWSAAASKCAREQSRSGPARDREEHDQDSKNIWVTPMAQRF
jgi:hypothetical protein